MPLLISLFISLCLSLSPSLILILSISLPVHSLSFYLSLTLFLFLSLSLYFSFSLSLSPSIYLFLSLSLLLSLSYDIYSLQDKWMYCDDISLDYAFAQSVLFKVYGSTVQETGHKTKGVFMNRPSLYQNFKPPIESYKTLNLK